MKEKEYKVDQETATVEFNRFTESMDLDVNLAEMSEEEEAEFKKHRGRLIKALQVGSLVINEEGEPIFTPQRGETETPIIFQEPRGSAIMAMDQKKKGHEVGKLYAIMADITGQTTGTFSKMKMSDLKICTAITTLFLA